MTIKSFSTLIIVSLRDQIFYKKFNINLIACIILVDLHRIFKKSFISVLFFSVCLRELFNLMLLTPTLYLYKSLGAVVCRLNFCSNKYAWIKAWQHDVTFERV